MATSKQPIAKKCRSFEVSPATMGYGNKKSTRNPGNANRRRKVSEYGIQLKEKQKVKFIYGVLEKQFHKYYLKASHMKGITGDNMLQLVLPSWYDGCHGSRVWCDSLPVGLYRPSLGDRASGSRQRLAWF